MAEDFLEDLGSRREADLLRIWQRLSLGIDQWTLDLAKVSPKSPESWDVFNTMGVCLSLCEQYAAPKIRILRVSAFFDLWDRDLGEEIGSLPWLPVCDLQKTAKETKLLAKNVSRQFVEDGESYLFEDLKARVKKLKAFVLREIEGARGRASDRSAMLGPYSDATPARAGTSRPITPDRKYFCRKRKCPSPRPSLEPPNKKRSSHYFYERRKYCGEEHCFL